MSDSIDCRRRTVDELFGEALRRTDTMLTDQGEIERLAGDAETGRVL